MNTFQHLNLVTTDMRLLPLILSLALSLPLSALAEAPRYGFFGAEQGLTCGLGLDYQPRQVIKETDSHWVSGSSSLDGNYRWIKEDSGGLDASLNWGLSQYFSLLGTGSYRHQRQNIRQISTGIYVGAPYSYYGGHFEAANSYAYLVATVIRPFGFAQGTGFVERTWMPVLSLGYAWTFCYYSYGYDFFDNAITAKLSTRLVGGVLVTAGVEDVDFLYGAFDRFYWRELGLTWRLGDLFGSPDAPQNQLGSGWWPTLGYSHRFSERTMAESFSLGLALSERLGVKITANYTHPINGDLSDEYRLWDYGLGLVF